MYQIEFARLINQPVIIFKPQFAKITLIKFEHCRLVPWAR